MMDLWPAVYQGDARAVLATLPAESVHVCVTSPPYYALRDYGVSGQIGLEESPECHVSALCEVFREVWRVLRKDGTLWVNYGDCYASGPPAGPWRDGMGKVEGRGANRNGSPCPVGLKPKDLMGMPWRIAFALQADGWWLRSDIIWSKLNPMPESVTDRPTRSHEYLFLLSKSASYWYDADAIREPVAADSLRESKSGRRGKEKAYAAGQGHTGPEMRSHWEKMRTNTAGRNKRTVWNLASQPLSDPHFASFPEALVEPCILAGTSERGCCPECGAGWKRMVEKGDLVPDAPGYKPRGRMSPDGLVNVGMTLSNGQPAPNHHRERIDKGWAPSCTCCRRCDILGIPAHLRGGIHATQRPGARKRMASSVGPAARAQGQEGGDPNPVSRNMQALRNGLHREEGEDFLQSQLFGEMDVGAGIGESNGRRLDEPIPRSHGEGEETEKASAHHGGSSRQESGAMGVGAPHQWGPERQSAGESGSAEHIPTCAITHEPPPIHELEPYPEESLVPAVVLDPFAGSGTTLKVAMRLGRRSIGIDLNGEYLAILRKRTAQGGLAL